MPEPLRLGLPREELAFSPGVIPALYQIVEDLVKPDHGKVLTMTPAYGFFLHACEYNGVELVTSPLRKVEGRFEMGWEDFRRKVTDPDVRVLMLCNPHNPDGGAGRRGWCAGGGAAPHGGDHRAKPAPGGVRRDPL